MIRRPPRSTLFPTRRSSDLEQHPCPQPAGCTHALAAEPGQPEVIQITTEESARSGEGRAQAHQGGGRSEEHTSELQSRQYLVCRLLLEKKNRTRTLHSPHAH